MILSPDQMFFHFHITDLSGIFYHSLLDMQIPYPSTSSTSWTGFNIPADSLCRITFFANGSFLYNSVAHHTVIVKPLYAEPSEKCDRSETFFNVFPGHKPVRAIKKKEMIILIVLLMIMLLQPQNGNSRIQFTFSPIGLHLNTIIGVAYNSSFHQ